MATLEDTSCCGIGEIDQVGYSSKAQILARIAEAGELNMGYVFATTTQDQKNAAAMLKSIGFSKLRKFRNPNTGNIVTWWAKKTGMTRAKVLAREARKERELERESRLLYNW